MSDRRPSTSRRSRRPTEPDGVASVGAGERDSDAGTDDPEHVTSDDADLTSGAPADDDGEWDEPNYLIRRVAAITVGVLLLAVVAFVIVRFVAGDDGSGNAGAPPHAEWDTLVVLTDGEIRLVDPASGDTVDSYDGPADLLDAASVVVDGSLVSLDGRGRIVVTDLVDGLSARSRAAASDATLLVSDSDPRLAIAGSSAGSDITVVDVASTAMFDVAEVAGLTDPLVFPGDVLASPDGTHVAMSDARSFQSVLVSNGDETAELLAGQVIALGDESVVSAQRAGTNTELEFYDLDGERLGQVDVTTPAASMLVAPDTMLIVDPDGTIETATAAGDVDDLGTLSVPATGADDGDRGENGSAATSTGADGPSVVTGQVTGGVTTSGGRRLVVQTDTRVFVIRDDGTQVTTVAGAVAGRADRSSRCIVVRTGGANRPSTLLDLESGDPVAEIPSGTVEASSVDGCTVAFTGPSGSSVVSRDGTVEVDADSIVDVAPDGSAVVVRDGRDTELLGITGGDEIELEEPVEIADEPVVIRFAQR